ncbi:calcium-binding protein [Albimonas pacifica]|uniref:Peptidase M10 serralysin C terminal n=1 Tax=Albimonas pacifica TaxID=1114924 RepID=A0A1I3HSF2_9RHOB|nr:calcium-binding protein [Albimonas pacifica]SFI38684.1 Peptidase M10 serralysin C terminal [Albimonas pacifica]
MTLAFIGTDTDGFTAAASGDMVVVVATGRLSITGFGDAFNFAGLSSVSLVVQGAIFSEDGDAVSSDVASGGLKVSVDAGGTIIGASDGVELNGNSHVVLNSGVIKGLSDAAVQLLGADGKVSNFGAMTGLRGVVLDGDDAELVNHGMIHGHTSSGVTASTNARIVNTGTITASGAAVLVAGTDVILRNFGEIASLAASAFSGGAGIDTVLNSGRMGGDVLLAGGDDLLRMSGGEIAGDVDAGSGFDRVVLAAGVVQGDVRLGDHDDVLRFGTGTVSGDLDAGLGADTVVLASGLLQGVATLGGGNDQLRIGTGEVDGSIDMGGGSDSVKLGHGLVQGDVFMGDRYDVFRAGDGRVLGSVDLGDGDDRAYGGAADETFVGGAGDDLLRGQGGEDELYGGDDADNLVGGRGDDRLVGGAAGDFFRFGRRTDDDLITDFQNGLDRIDLSRLVITGDELTAIKDASKTLSGNSVMVDLDKLGGDGSIQIIGLTKAQMTLDDFIL